MNQQVSSDCNARSLQISVSPASNIEILFISMQLTIHDSLNHLSLVIHDSLVFMHNNS